MESVITHTCVLSLFEYFHHQIVRIFGEKTMFLLHAKLCLSSLFYLLPGSQSVIVRIVHRAKFKCPVLDQFRV